MKESKGQGIETISGVWKNLTSNISDKIKKAKNNFTDQNQTRDMGDSHTPVSRLDLTGLNREQAKEQLCRVIDERLEMISHIELTELKIDYKERERQRAKAAARINERRNRRKQQSEAPAEPIVTDQGVYSNYRHASVFDVIQPEPFPFEEAQAADPLEGQLSIADTLAAQENIREVSVNTEFAAPLEIELPEAALETERPVMTPETELPAAAPELESPAAAIQAEAAPPEDDHQYSFDLFQLINSKPEEGAFPEELSVNTSLDEAVDRVFAFYEKSREKAIALRQVLRRRASETVQNRLLPAREAVAGRVTNRLTPLLAKAESKVALKTKTDVLFAVLAKREKQAAEKMACLIDFADRKNEAFLHSMVVLRSAVCRRADQLREAAEENKKKILIGFSAAVAVAAAVTIVIGSMTAYEYIYNGKVLGVVKNQEDVYKTIDIIGDKLSSQYAADITIDKEKDIRFNKVVAFQQDLDSKEDILNRLTYMRDMKANGHGIYVAGTLVAVLESEGTAREILKDIQDNFLKQDAGVQYEKVGFAEEIAIQDVETKLGDIQDKEKVLEYMMTGAVEKKIHVVQSGETFSEIAKLYGLKQSELQVSNPDVIPEKLQIAQEISLNRIVPLVTVQTTEIAQYLEEIPFEIQYENTSNMYKTEQTVKTKGVNGTKDVVAEIVRNNGIEVSRREISSTVLSEPSPQLVLVGTKEPPPLIGTGSFIYPIRGTLTSRYGTRWGRLHAGIDLGAPIGTKIKAADGGKVTFAGYKGALGYMVEIDHGGGRVTWYGHCSKLHVKKGDRVYQGQHIANVGNTGRSTGPHLHFEVHINGKTKNPLNYL